MDGPPVIELKSDPTPLDVATAGGRLLPPDELDDLRRDLLTVPLHRDGHAQRLPLCGELRRRPGSPPAWGSVPRVVSGVVELCVKPPAHEGPCF